MYIGPGDDAQTRSICLTFAPLSFNYRKLCGHNVLLYKILYNRFPLYASGELIHYGDTYIFDVYKDHTDRFQRVCDFILELVSHLWNTLLK